MALLFAALTLGGLVAIVWFALKYGEDVVQRLGDTPAATPEAPMPVLAGEPEERVPAPPPPEPPRPAATSVPTPDVLKERAERYPDRRVETAARVLVAEIEEYLATPR